MSDVTLTKIETAILTAAATQHGGSLALPKAMKPVTAKRLIGRLRKHGIVEGDEPHLTRAGYTLVGIRPPRTNADGSSAPGKGAMILALIGRPDGASLPELTSATGWLPHTTRAAICRLRQGGQAIVRSPRPDGVGAYRIVAPAPLARPGRRRAEAKAA